MKKYIFLVIISVCFLIWFSQLFFHNSIGVRRPKHQINTQQKQELNQLNELKGQMLRTKDGDTLSIRDTSGHIYDVRLNAIDAPELSQPHGMESKIALFELCDEAEISVDVLGNDRYGRTIGRVKCDGVDVQVAQVQQGWAWVFDKYVGDDTYLYSYQTNAQKNQLGLWKDQSHIPPWEWRILSK